MSSRCLTAGTILPPAVPTSAPTIAARLTLRIHSRHFAAHVPTPRSAARITTSTTKTASRNRSALIGSIRRPDVILAHRSGERGGIPRRYGILADHANRRSSFSAPRRHGRVRVRALGAVWLLKPTGTYSLFSRVRFG